MISSFESLSRIDQTFIFLAWNDLRSVKIICLNILVSKIHFSCEENDLLRTKNDLIKNKWFVKILNDFYFWWSNHFDSQDFRNDKFISPRKIIFRKIKSFWILKSFSLDQWFFFFWRPKVDETFIFGEVIRSQNYCR
jgi:hypothetical protein